MHAKDHRDQAGAYKLKSSGYNEKYPSGLTKVTFSPPLSMILIFETFAGRPNPVELNPG